MIARPTDHETDHVLTAHDDDTRVLVARCPACGDVVDYCMGHGEIGDPDGYRRLVLHDYGEHVECHPDGCTEYRFMEYSNNGITDHGDAFVDWLLEEKETT